MVGKLFLFMISFVGVMAAGPALAVAAIFLMKVDFDGLVAQHGTLLSVVFALYMSFVVFMFFSLQDRFIVFRPEPGKTPRPKAEVVALLEKAFTTPVEGGKLFDFMAQGDRVVITWSSSLDYFQLTNVGGRGMKRVIVLTLDEADRDAFFIMKDKDWRWNVSKNFFSFSLNYSTGIFSEYESETYPSISFSENGGLRVDLKKLKYSSNELWIPIQTALLSSGWTLRGGMMPKFYQRVLLALPLGIVCFAFGFLVTGMGKPSLKAVAINPPVSRESGATTRAATDSKRAEPSRTQAAAPLPEGVSSLEKMVSHMTTENIQVVLQGVMMTPPDYLNEETRKSFVAYGNGYLAKPDRKEDFSSKIRTFAAKNKIQGLKE
ncbi:MAG TPA: hypothetical protein VGJ94_16505 [Syntrophorhabdaceae bacterium]|jgi:hypothetical protein